jgi:hypothetical protein
MDTSVWTFGFYSYISVWLYWYRYVQTNMSIFIATKWTYWFYLVTSRGTVTVISRPLWTFSVIQPFLPDPPCFLRTSLRCSILSTKVRSIFSKNFVFHSRSLVLGSNQIFFVEPLFHV